MPEEKVFEKVVEILKPYANDADAFDFIAGMMELMSEATPKRNLQPTNSNTNRPPSRGVSP